MTEIHGHCDERFEPVRDAFAANFDRGLERGASVAVTLDGEPVVDLWAGDADGDGPPWERGHHRQRAGRPPRPWRPSAC